MIDLKKKPTLVGEKIVLRPFQPEDFSYMEECLMDLEVMKFTGSDSDYDRDFVMEWYSTRNIQENRLDLAIVDKKQQIPVGEAVINLYDEMKHSMNFRILIGPRGRDRAFDPRRQSL